jgi:hypothetical protein
VSHRNANVHAASLETSRKQQKTARRAVIVPGRRKKEDGRIVSFSGASRRQSGLLLGNYLCCA